MTLPGIARAAAFALFLAVFLLPGAALAGGPSCAISAAPGCGFYATCIERACPCGPDGYALGYGRKYCRRISGLEGLSPAGRRWRNGVVSCLQHRLSEALPKTDCDCRAIARKAYASHYGCYARAPVSICDLPPRDIALIEASIDDSDKTNAAGLRVLLRLSVRCLATNPANTRAAMRAVRLARRAR